MGNLCSLSSGSRPEIGNTQIELPNQLPCLPDDVIFEILLCMPIKSIARLRCVSKFWYNVIKSPIFINNHLTKTKKYTVTLSAPRKLCPSKQDLVLYFQSLEQKNKPTKYSTPLLKNLNLGKRVQQVSVLGIHKGIVCLRITDKIVLCNPALKEFKLLPTCPFDTPLSYYDIIIGGGFGSTYCSRSSTHIFNVVLIRSVIELNNGTYNLVHSYSSRTNSWREGYFHIHAKPTEESERYSYKPFINGACHWSAYDSSQVQFPQCILSFDIKNEVLKKFEYPDVANRTLFSCLCLMGMNECLAMVMNYRQMNTSLWFSEVWVMKEYGVKESWSRQVVIRLLGVRRALLPWKNDEWMLVTDQSEKLSAIELSSGKNLKLKISCKNNTFWVYEESLISVYP